MSALFPESGFLLPSMHSNLHILSPVLAYRDHRVVSYFMCLDLSISVVEYQVKLSILILF